MKAVKKYRLRDACINTSALIAVAEKHNLINALINAGQPIDPDLSKNFVSFPLSDNPYKD